MKLHLHDYSRWSAPIKTHAGYKQQWCTCKICGKAKFRTLPWDKLAQLPDIINALAQGEQND